MINRRYRNRRIGDFLKELQLTEGRNTGLRKILRALEKNGSPLPEFETDEERSYFITRLFIHLGFIPAPQVPQGIPQVPQAIPQALHELLSIEEINGLTDIRRSILLIIQENPSISQSKIALKLDRDLEVVKSYGGRFADVTDEENESALEEF